MVEIDLIAKEQAITRFGLHPGVHFPIAARNKESIERYVGEIKQELSRNNTHRAFLVSVPPIEKNALLPIWQLERSSLINQEMQVWVHVDFKSYRRAYKRAFPNDVLNNMVLGHILNRNVAHLKFFEYVRLLPISRAVNSSSVLAEKWSMDYLKSPDVQKANRESLKNIQYADICDIAVMLNIMPGGGVMNAVNDIQYLMDLPK